MGITHLVLPDAVEVDALRLHNGGIAAGQVHDVAALNACTPQHATVHICHEATAHGCLEGFAMLLRSMPARTSSLSLNWLTQGSKLMWCWQLQPSRACHWHDSDTCGHGRRQVLDSTNRHLGKDRPAMSASTLAGSARNESKWPGMLTRRRANHGVCHGAFRQLQHQQLEVVDHKMRCLVDSKAVSRLTWGGTDHGVCSGAFGELQHQQLGVVDGHHHRQRQQPPGLRQEEYNDLKNESFRSTMSPHKIATANVSNSKSWPAAWRKATWVAALHGDDSAMQL